MLAVAFLGNAVACVGRRRRLLHSTVVAFHTRREQEVHRIDESRELAHVLDSGQLGRLRRRRSWHESCHSGVAELWCVGLSTIANVLRSSLQLLAHSDKLKMLNKSHMHGHHTLD